MHSRQARINIPCNSQKVNIFFADFEIFLWSLLCGSGKWREGAASPLPLVFSFACAERLPQKNLKICEKHIDNSTNSCYINSCLSRVHGGVAQLARACGSYPQCHRFESSRRYHRRRDAMHLSCIPTGFLLYMARWSSG